MKYYNRWVDKFESLMGENKTTNNMQINEVGHKYLGEEYGGCMPADIFVKYIKRNGTGDGKIYIVNTENSREDGEHWICFVDDPETLLGYDSYGENIKEEYDPAFKRIEFVQDVSDREQRFNTEFNCGPRALAAGKTYKKFGREGFLLI